MKNIIFCTLHIPVDVVEISLNGFQCQCDVLILNFHFYTHNFKKKFKVQGDSNPGCSDL